MESKIDFIGFNATVKKPGQSGELQIMVHAGNMELTDSEIRAIRKETECLAEKIERIITGEEKM